MNSHRLLGFVAIAGVLLYNGTIALTASNQSSPTRAGASSSVITGVTAESITYDINGSNIDSVHLVLAGDTTDTIIEIGFNDDSPTTCSKPGRYDGNASTTYDCRVTQSLIDASALVVLARSSG